MVKAKRCMGYVGLAICMQFLTNATSKVLLGQLSLHGHLVKPLFDMVPPVAGGFLVEETQALEPPFGAGSNAGPLGRGCRSSCLAKCSNQNRGPQDDPLFNGIRGIRPRFAYIKEVAQRSYRHFQFSMIFVLLHWYSSPCNCTNGSWTERRWEGGTHVEEDEYIPATGWEVG